MQAKESDEGKCIDITAVHNKNWICSLGVVDGSSVDAFIMWKIKFLCVNTYKSIEIHQSIFLLEFAGNCFVAIK